jgi:hypothetical protein
MTILGITVLVLTNSRSKMADSLKILQNETHKLVQASNAHFIWRQELTEAVLTGSRFRGSLDPNKCAFGKWLDYDHISIADEMVLSLLKDIITPHDFIHREAHTLMLLSADDARRNLFEVVLPETQKVTAILMQLESRYLRIGR